jgi:TonB family protein
MKVISVALLIAALTFGSAVAARAAAPVFAAEWEVARGLQKVVLPNAPAKSESGLAIVKVRIDQAGAVVSAKTQLGDKDLSKVVEPALASWHYRSFDYQGKKIEIETYVSVVYSKEENRFFVQGANCVYYGPPAAQFDVGDVKGESDGANGVGRIEVPGDSDVAAPSREMLVPADVLAAKAIDRPQPAYPEAAAKVSATGDVTVRVVVSKSGQVVYAAPVDGHRLLHGDAVRAARRWRFSPTMRDDKSVDVIGSIVIRFRR